MTTTFTLTSRDSQITNKKNLYVLFTCITKNWNKRSLKEVENNSHNKKSSSWSPVLKPKGKDLESKLKITRDNSSRSTTEESDL